MPEVAHRQTPTHILTIKCQLSFFYGRLTIFVGHLGHEYQQRKFHRAVDKVNTVGKFKNLEATTLI